MKILKKGLLGINDKRNKLLHALAPIDSELEELWIIGDGQYNYST